MKQEKQETSSPIRSARPARLIRNPAPFSDETLARIDTVRAGHDERDITRQPTRRLSLFADPETLNQYRAAITSLTPDDYQQIDDELDDAFDLSNINTVQLMQLSGMLSMQMPAVSIKNAITGTHVAVTGQTIVKPQPQWKILLNNPIVKGVIGLVVGVLILLLLARLIPIKETVATIKETLTTPSGILHTCLAGLAFVAAFSFRGVRWKLFLNPVEKINVFKVIRIYWIGVFINFLLPVQGGELAKSVILKQVAGVPISQSLPIVAIDKALDLMPVLFIIAIVPFIPGIQMNLLLWLMLALVGGILLGLIIVVALTAWNRKAALALIHFFLRLLPKGIGEKIEGFAMGFVDSLLAGASRPKTFIVAVLLTALAVSCEGLFAWEGFHAVQLNPGLGLTIFGYTFYTLFSILPTPPAGIGSNEGAKDLVFIKLLGFNSIKVNAMAILVHLVCVILIGAVGLLSLKTLGLNLSTILQKQQNKGTKK